MKVIHFDRIEIIHKLQLGNGNVNQLVDILNHNLGEEGKWATSKKAGKGILFQKLKCILIGRKVTHIIMRTNTAGYVRQTPNQAYFYLSQI